MIYYYRRISGGSFAEPAACPSGENLSLSLSAFQTINQSNKAGCTRTRFSYVILKASEETRDAHFFDRVSRVKAASAAAAAVANDATNRGNYNGGKGLTRRVKPI